MKYFILFSLFLSLKLSAEVKLPALFSDNMVLQREIEAPVWGWANPGEKVVVEFGNETKSIKADKDGEWTIKLSKLEASSKPRDLTIKGENTIILKNVLVGDVWLCSGQSNMEWSLNRCSGDVAEMAKSQQKNKQLRLFRIPKHIKSATPAKDTEGTWKTTENVDDSLSFSGCGFFFGGQLQEELNIPIGLIDSSWGGTRVDQWISNKAHESFLGKNRNGPSIFNGMIAPLVPFAIKGAIWYQGESNRKDEYPAYYTKMNALITGWRECFEVGDFPFYQVQIAPFKYNKRKKGDDETLCRNIWATQYKAAKEIKNCGVVPSHDTIQGIITDIHPRDKKPISERLVNLALTNNYGKDLPITGPEFASAKISSGKIEVSFNHLDKGLTTNDNKEPNCFEVAGDDKIFVAAKASIKGDKVIVNAKDIQSPKYVRMGWLETSVPNLADKNGWPVFQFSAQEVSKR